jgi:hypothetical protein
MLSLSTLQNIQLIFDVTIMQPSDISEIEISGNKSSSRSRRVINKLTFCAIPAGAVFD